VITRLIRDKGARVDAVDIATIALQKLKNENMENINAIHDYLPTTTLNDDFYDLVLFTEVIGYLTPHEYRIAIAEVSRIVKPDGYVICSSSLDIDTEDPLEKFATLAETEFDIHKWILTNDYLLIKLCKFFEAPSAYIKANRDREYRLLELDKRKGFSKTWFQWNSSAPLSYCWHIVDWIFTPIAKGLRQSPRIMNVLERISSFFWSHSGISHALFIGKRRPLSHPLPENEIPRELKHKRQLWE
jgi:SAM-dependent methyltransferase